MRCPMCGSEETEKAIFNNGRLGRYLSVTAIGFYCTSCNHSALVLVPTDSPKVLVEAETIAASKFRLWEAYV